MRLFTERGYDASTVADVAAAAEVSSMTVIRRFPTEEDLVMADEYDPVIIDAIRAQPADEPLLRRIGAALVETTAAHDAADRAILPARPQLGLPVPALRDGCGTANTAASKRCAAKAPIPTSNSSCGSPPARAWQPCPPLGVGQQPLQPSVLLAQFVEFLGGLGVDAAVLAAPVVERGGGYPDLGSAISSPVLPAVVSSSARRSFRTMSSAECRLRPAMSMIVPSRPSPGQTGL